MTCTYNTANQEAGIPRLWESGSIQLTMKYLGMLSLPTQLELCRKYLQVTGNKPFIIRNTILQVLTGHWFLIWARLTTFVLQTCHSYGNKINGTVQHIFVK